MGEALLKSGAMDFELLCMMHRCFLWNFLAKSEEFLIIFRNSASLTHAELMHTMSERQ